MTRPEINTDNLHLRKSIKQIEQSIDELKKAKAVLVSMLPKKTVSAKNIIIKLSNGRSVDALGREVNYGR
jgi:hypothetical protein